MADVSVAFQTSTPAPADPYPGWLLLPVKDALVSAGWTVVGSGDGLARFGHADAATTVPLAQQGSGGQYDCWSVANVANGIAGGAGNSEGWCHLRDPNGTRDLLMGADPSGFPQSHLGVVGFSREDAANLDGSASNATTKPVEAVADDICWVVGTGPSSGGYLCSNTTATGDILHAAMVVIDDGTEFAWFTYYYDDSLSVYDANSNEGWVGVVSVANPHPDDPDPWYYIQRSGTSNPFQAWNYLDSAYANYTTTSAPNLVDSRTAPAEELFYPYIEDDTGAPTMTKGVANPDMVLAGDALYSFGDRLTEVSSSRVYVHIRPTDTMRIMLRWPDTATTLVGATHTDINVWDPFYTSAVDVTADFTVVAYDPLNAPNATIVSTSTTLDFNITSSLGAVDPTAITISLDGNTIWDGATFTADFSGSSFSAGAGSSQDLSLVKATPWADGTRYELVINLT